MRDIVRRVRSAGRDLVREMETLKHGYMGTDFTFSQCHVLYELFCSDTANLKELSEKLLVDKANLSRTVQHLIDEDQISVSKNPDDRRQKIYRLTKNGQKSVACINGQAESQVEGALSLLSETDRETVAKGLELYVKGLRKQKKRSQITVRPIEPKDNPAVANVIREVMTEFGAVGEGYSIGDPEVDTMYESYQGEGAKYYVLEIEDKIVGCAGLANLVGGEKDVCELRKMYFLPEIRGLGLGQELLEMCLKDAREFGYRTCYIETIDRMKLANKLYTRNGFIPLDAPLGSTGHCGCDSWYSMEL